MSDHSPAATAAAGEEDHWPSFDITPKAYEEAVAAIAKSMNLNLVGWEVKHGRLGRMVRNPTYTGIGPQFWGAMDMLGGGSEWIHWGVPNCGKGQPMQTAHTGHPSVPARFRGIRVGVRG